MNVQIDIAVDAGVVRVTSIGLASELAEQAIERAHLAAAEQGLQRVLFDIRQVEMDDGFVQILDYGRLARRFGFDNRYRIAVL